MLSKSHTSLYAWECNARVLHVKKKITSIKHCQESRRERQGFTEYLWMAHLLFHNYKRCALSVTLGFQHRAQQCSLCNPNPQRPNAYVCLGLLCQITSPKEHLVRKSQTASWKPISWLGCKRKLWDSEGYNGGGKSWIPTIWWVNKTIYNICLQHEGREKPHLTCTATHSLCSAAWLHLQKASNIYNSIHYMQLHCAPKPFCWRCLL